MNSSIFVTGTDTGIGKTHASCALLRRLISEGKIASGMKPVASGCEMTSHGLRNADAQALRAASSHENDYALVNPYAYLDPIAPHLAAAESGTPISLDVIRARYDQLAAESDVVVVEGVGGWAAPLGANLTQADLVRTLKLDVVLVVGLRLGCINHALLTARAIQADGCHMIGWIANRIDPYMLRADDNLQTLQAHLRAPLVAVLDYDP